MEHKEEIHNKHLQRLCRLCGGIVLTSLDIKKYNYKYKCTDFSMDIFTVFGIDISLDKENVHPKDFCHKCYKLIGRTLHEKSVDAINKLRARFSFIAWPDRSKHIKDYSQCEVCERLACLLRGGRKKKAKGSTSKQANKVDPSSTVSSASEQPPSPFDQAATVDPAPTDSAAVNQPPSPCEPADTVDPTPTCPVASTQPPSPADSAPPALPATSHSSAPHDDDSTAADVMIRSPVHPLSPPAMSVTPAPPDSADSSRPFPDHISHDTLPPPSSIESKSCQNITTDSHNTEDDQSFSDTTSFIDNGPTHSTPKRQRLTNDSSTLQQTPGAQLSKTTCDSLTSPAFKNDIILDNPLSTSLDNPLGKEKEKIFSHWAKTKIHQEGKTITCHNRRGLPFTMTQVHKSKVNLEKASASTKYRKAMEVKKSKKNFGRKWERNFDNTT